MVWLEGVSPGCTLAETITTFFDYENLNARLVVPGNRF